MGNVCVFITAVPITVLFAWGAGDIGGHVLRETVKTSTPGSRLFVFVGLMFGFRGLG
jgi:hypothetical protein